MKTASLLAACAIVVIANAVALGHAARNRAGSPEAEVTLTERELPYPFRSPSNDNDDNSGVTLNLVWAGAGNLWSAQDGVYRNWLDASKLRTLGFDCSVDPASPAAPRFYQRQRPRQAWVALENDGPAYRAWLDTARQNAGAASSYALASRTHLIAIDADLDPAHLRMRHPDRTTIIILPAIIALNLSNLYPATPGAARNWKGTSSRRLHPSMFRVRSAIGSRTWAGTRIIAFACGMVRCLSLL
jgi:hypothetical protein